MSTRDLFIGIILIVAIVVALLILHNNGVL